MISENEARYLMKVNVGSKCAESRNLVIQENFHSLFEPIKYFVVFNFQKHMDMLYVFSEIEVLKTFISQKFIFQKNPKLTISMQADSKYGWGVLYHIAGYQMIYRDVSQYQFFFLSYCQTLQNDILVDIIYISRYLEEQWLQNKRLTVLDISRKKDC